MTDTPVSDDATMTAARRMAAAVPLWTGTGRAADLVGLERGVLLHAGPPFRDPAAVCAPVLNAAASALVFEGMAEDFDAARAMLRSGAVALRPAQDHGVVTPLASIVSASTWLQVVEDPRTPGVRAYSPLNEGAGPALRFGLAGPAVVERLVLLRDVVGPALAEILAEPVALFPIARAALASGDDLHGRTGAATARLLDELRPRLAGRDGAAAFLDGAGQFFLNLWMAACKAMMMAGDGVPGAALVTAAGGNGVEFGLRLSGGRGWTAAPAGVPEGPDAGPKRPRLPAIGDSAVVDAMGFGALALDAAPELRADLGAAAEAVPADLGARLLLIDHPALGRRVGLDSRAVVETGAAAPVCLGALDLAGEAGIVGRGIAWQPMACHREAVERL